MAIKIPLHQLLPCTQAIGSPRELRASLHSFQVQAALGSSPAFCCWVSLWGCSLSSSRVRSPSWYHRLAVFTPTPKTWVKSYVEEGTDGSGAKSREDAPESVVFMPNATGQGLSPGQTTVTGD